MEKVIELAYELKSLLDNDERVIQCNKLESIMANDEEAMKLSYKKDLAVDQYDFAISHFPKDSKEVKSAQEGMHLAKLELDKCESVRNYLDAYSKVRDLYMEINNILFSFMNNHLCSKGCK